MIFVILIMFLCDNVHVHADVGIVVLPLQTQCSYGDPDSLEFALDGRMYELEYQMVDGDMDPPEYALAGADLSAQGE